MRLVTYESTRLPHLGVVQDERVLDVRTMVEMLSRRRVPRLVATRAAFKAAAHKVLAPAFAPRDMLDLLTRGEEWLRALGFVSRSLAKAIDPERAPKGLSLPLQHACLRAPVLRPGKIVCVGRNYAEHARERGSEIPTQPVYFLKSNNTICGPDDPILLPPNSNQVDYEAELAVVIGKGGKRIPEARAYEHIAGYTILNDVSARDLQAQDKQWFRAKSCDSFAPTGPWIVTREEIADPHRLRISLTLNGETMQDSNTQNMIFKIPYLVSYLSQSLTWEPGDILSTGTPAGIGAGRMPPVFLSSADSVSITVEGIGTLTNPVSA